MRFIKTIVVVALMTGDLHLHAQSVGIEYTTELQTNFRDFNFVNLLRLNAEMPISKTVTIGASTISIAKTRDERLVDDLQAFSNIEEDDLPLAIAMCGANWQINDKHSLFMGIRNMNEDYFTSPLTSFFTNSSCGVYPTISSNADIANYPLASVGVHYKYETERLCVQASLYNGEGHNRFSGRDNIFRLCPHDDGVFSLSEIQYHNKGRHYFLGNALHSGPSFFTAPWLYIEQQICDELTILAGFSHTFGNSIECKDFKGLGIYYQQANYHIGIITDYATYCDAREWASELTMKYSFYNHAYLQPALHMIRTGNHTNIICSIRLGLTLPE